ncbi:DNA-binding protein [Deinococcus irradiatisoli]|uniref:DNA-binding protein n=1 Tax=Deinococcus irradiatisoli TaxID=2202254 RepID=A0A2Z3JBN3_9DEIO|nr:DinB family protein [Deinococcus irradiatisoli]AWN22385.1 DNA-binding protein [Deinococcus irradiatisoli]
MPPSPLSAPRFWKVLLTLGLLSVAALLLTRRTSPKALVAGAVLEAPARRRRYAELRRGLNETGLRLEKRLAGADDTEANREVVRHIIGIERWGQARLEELLGADPVLGGHRPYRPADDLGLAQLRGLAALTRAQTGDLARRLEAQAPVGRAKHDGLGPLSARAWLRYLTLHAEIEGRRLK